MVIDGTCNQGLINNGFDESIISAEDEEFGLRLFVQGHRIKFSERLKVQHKNSTDLKSIIGARREGSFYEYKIAQRYPEELRKKYFSVLFKKRYKCIFLENRGIEKFLLGCLNLILPFFIGVLFLMLKFLHGCGFKHSLYPIFFKTIGIAGYHGKVLARYQERGY